VIRQRVNAARAIQLQRFHKRNLPPNPRMGAREIRRYCTVNEPAEKLLETAINKLGLSARAYSRVLKVARTTATSPAPQTSNPPTLPKRFNTGAWTEEHRGADRPSAVNRAKSPMLVLKLILRRLCRGLVDRLLFRLRYFFGFALFALILWFLKFVLAWLIEIKYWDGIKSNQFENHEEQNQTLDSTQKD
jgi:hypothetical protein